MQFVKTGKILNFFKLVLLPVLSLVSSQKNHSSGPHNFQFDDKGGVEIKVKKIQIEQPVLNLNFDFKLKPCIVLRALYF